MAIFQPSPDQIKEAAKSVWYEWQMFNITSRFCPIAQRFLGVMQNTTIESFLLHTRILTDFFFPSQNLKRSETWDVILASDYLPEWNLSRESHLENNCVYLGNNYERINKALTHLSYSRSKYKTIALKKWKYDKIHEELSATWHDFWRQLTDEQQNWFDGNN
ncbi:MAG: hypothetical protein PHZ00_03460 [Candidatus Peribacteraceae bacterium]|nr:hypothetical protein [Candidatus Peribacteraceae bacterium]